jgi:pyridoxine/pyridoxamine 5'-phosphate oxidase
MREAEDSGVSRCEGLGTADWGKLGGRRYWNRQGYGSRLLELYYKPFHAQSQPISSRAYLLPGMEELKQRYPDKDTVPLPDSLQGVYLYPTEIDVWHGSPDDRLHDRRLFTRTATGWSCCTLMP